MPRFIFNKLVRDKLVEEFERMGQVAVHRSLTSNDHVEALKQKIIEEVQEIPVGGRVDDLISEIADVQQALDDLKALNHITDQQVDDVRQEKYDKKGGFLSGYYVETLELADGDEWVRYYRDHPDLFPEVNLANALQRSAATVQPGVYRHYKGNEYRVIAVGRHTETEEELVIYQPLYQSDVAYWVRPLEMFLETVTIDGKSHQRFSRREM